MSPVAGVDLGKTGCRATTEDEHGNGRRPPVQGPGASSLAESNGLERAVDAVWTTLVRTLPDPGGTPYVLAALEAARSVGCRTVAVVNNVGTPDAAGADVAIELLTGAEVIAGSTRLKAGTAQKVTLNALSTGAMVRHGKTYGAWMVDVVASNEKLRRRARRILREATGADDDRATAVLEAAGWHTKTALVALVADVDVRAATALLDAGRGRVRAALQLSSAGREEPG